jgi:hypothetical protein
MSQQKLQNHLANFIDLFRPGSYDQILFYRVKAGRNEAFPAANFDCTDSACPVRFQFLVVTERRNKYVCTLSCLQNFAYRVNLRIGIFALSGLAALALLTVSYQIIKAATANPADSLRYE